MFLQARTEGEGEGCEPRVGEQVPHLHNNTGTEIKHSTTEALIVKLYTTATKTFQPNRLGKKKKGMKTWVSTFI